MEWTIPAHPGVRTQYRVDAVADRAEVAKMLDDYIARGYLKEVSAAEQVFLSPLLPRPKPVGFRLTNDYRRLNKYFPVKGATTQVEIGRAHV